MRVSASLLTSLHCLGDEEASKMLELWLQEENKLPGRIEVYFYVDPIVDPNGYFYIHIPIPERRTVTYQGLSEPDEDG
jgi:hypothetical protein